MPTRECHEYIRRFVESLGADAPAARAAAR
jgi:hypothetical protein